MVQVSPSKGTISIKAGWIFFTIICLIVFPLLFANVPNAGLNWYEIGVGIVVAVVVDIWVLGAPPPAVLGAVLIGAVVFLVKVLR